jgi:hypothetical protein
MDITMVTVMVCRNRECVRDSDCKPDHMCNRVMGCVPRPRCFFHSQCHTYQVGSYFLVFSL